jgi:hypothetical protein
MTEKRFGYFTPREDGTIDAALIDQLVVPEVYEEFERVVGITSELRPFVIDFLSLKTNFASFFGAPDIIKNDFEKLPNPLKTGGVAQAIVLAKAQGPLSNFLSSASSFRDRASTRLRERYGAASLQARQLTAAIKDCYDGSLAYRLLYNLRNFEQHHDMPLSVVPIAGQRDEAGAMRFRVQILLDPQLLAQSPLTQERFARDELPNLKHRFDLIALARRYMDLHAGLMKAVVDMHAERLSELQAYARVIFEKFKIPKGAIPVIWEGELENPTYYQFSFDELGLLIEWHNSLRMPLLDGS